MIDAQDFVVGLIEALGNEAEDPQTGIFSAAPISSIRNFVDSELLTLDDGFVVRMADGSEFQVTVVCSR